jgi:hypothetical protein
VTIFSTAATGFCVLEIIFSAAKNAFFIVQTTFGVSQKRFCVSPTIFYAPEIGFSLQEKTVGEAPAVGVTENTVWAALQVFQKIEKII